LDPGRVRGRKVALVGPDEATAMNKKIWPGVYTHNIDEVIEFEEWFGRLGGNGRYIGDCLQIIGGPGVAPGETVTFYEGKWEVEL
jgi:hypothetical protein